MNGMLRLLVLGVYVVVVAGCGGGGGGDESSASGRACNMIGLNNKIINGSSCDLSGSPVVRVMALVGSGSSERATPICTGTLVTPDVVLTAAHCLKSEFNGARVTGFGIYYGEPGAGTFIRWSGYSVCPGYRYEPSVSRAFNDVALIRLKSPAAIPVVPVLLSRSAQIGEPGFVYGYGQREEVSGGSDFFTLEAGAMTVQEVTTDHLFVAFDGGGVNVCFGDSGGPLVIEANGNPAVAGVVSQGSNMTCTPLDVTTFTNLQSPTVLAWLVDMVPNAYARSYSEVVEDLEKL